MSTELNSFGCQHISSLVSRYSSPSLRASQALAEPMIMSDKATDKVAFAVRKKAKALRSGKPEVFDSELAKDLNPHFRQMLSIASREELIGGLGLSGGEAERLLPILRDPSVEGIEIAVKCDRPITSTETHGTITQTWR